MNYRKPLALLLCVLCLTANAQQVDTWNMYMSYQIATKSDVCGSIIYSLMNGNLLSYDTEDGEVRTYDRLSGLSDVSISHIAYSKAASKLLIVYSNSNVDLLDGNDNIQNLPSLKDKRILNKEVSNVCIDGSTAYLATGFGFVEVDMNEGVFRNTYKLSYNIKSIAASESIVFLATTQGLMQCKKTDNMHIEENWTVKSSSTGFTHLCILQDKLVAMKSDEIYAFGVNDKSSKTLAKTKNTFLKSTGGQVIWGNATEIGYTYDADKPESVTTIPFDNNWSDVSYVGGTYWMSEQENGLKGYKMSGTEFVPTGQVVQPSSPIRDLSYNLSWVDNRLLVAGGVNTTAGFSNPATSMYYENGEWTNFTEMEKPAEYPKLRIINTTNLVQDPLDDTHHFASLYRAGLCEYRNGKFVKHYNHKNSPLHSLLPTSSQYYNYVMCAALSYDANNNLWMASSMRDTALHVLKPDGNWVNLYYEELDATSLIDQILHHSSGIKLITSRSLEKRGVFCLDTNGTERTSDDKFVMHRNILNQDGTPYSPDAFYCLCEDMDGKVWVGTSLGIFVIDDVSQALNPNFQFTQIKINRDDGSGLADYLLNDVSIACIAIDAANRKWIGTQNNGAYLISADGQKMIHHFTTEDTPLLSDNVQSIAVNPTTGEVVFGTDKGLCSYYSDATSPEDELDKDNVTVYPNPVTPDYNGPIVIRGLVADTEVKIVSTGGQLIWNGTSVGGTCTWNGCANNGAMVASGIYHVVANTPEGNKAIVTRIIVVK